MTGAFCHETARFALVWRGTWNALRAGVFDRPPVVVVAEDDDEFRALLASALRGDGHSVLEACDAAELRDRLLTGPLPDLVVSDVRMPGESGLDVLRWLRREGSEIPVVMITAFGDSETHSEAKACGVAAMFDKPFEIDDLRTAVLHILGRVR